MSHKKLTILIPTYERVTALASTLTSLGCQTFTDFEVVISDQSESQNVFDDASVQTAIRMLELHDSSVETYRHLPNEGLAEHRQFLLDQCQTEYGLFLDDDLILEPYVIGILLQTIQKEECGFVGSPVIGLSYLNDVRPHQQHIELWHTKVQPETVLPNTPAWERYQLHNAANPLHIAQNLQASPNNPITYKIAWVGGCCLYDIEKLRNMGGFSFWSKLPKNHSGEDVLAQLRVMREYGGCGVLPSGVYHQELPTTVPVREVNAPEFLSIEERN